jgi:DnaK suppressor protein
MKKKASKKTVSKPKPKAKAPARKKAAGKKTAAKGAKKAAKKPVKKAAKAAKRVRKARPAPKVRKPAKKSIRKAAAKPARKAAGKVVKKAARKASGKAAPARSASAAPAKAKVKGLSPKKIEHFRAKLLSEKQRVLEEMGEIASSSLKKSISDESGENSRYSYHLGDVASLSYGREFTMGLAERQQKYLEQIDDALQRMDEGTYGICKVTGELIPSERLEEVPIAKYSVRGKEILEQQRRHGYDSRRMQGQGVTDEQRRAYELVSHRRPLET